MEQCSSSFLHVVRSRASWHGADLTIAHAHLQMFYFQGSEPLFKSSFVLPYRKCWCILAHNKWHLRMRIILANAHLLHESSCLCFVFVYLFTCLFPQRGFLIVISNNSTWRFVRCNKYFQNYDVPTTTRGYNSDSFTLIKKDHLGDWSPEKDYC